jgi:hypothetical protein
MGIGQPTLDPDRAAVRGTVDRLDRVLVRCECEAERRLALLVEPVGQEPNAELALYGHVPHMRRGRFLGGEAGELVAIHVQRHVHKDDGRYNPRTTGKAARAEVGTAIAPNAGRSVARPPALDTGGDPGLADSTPRGAARRSGLAAPGVRS